MLFAIGGGQDNCSDCECYDPTTDHWNMIAPIPSKRERMGVAFFNNKIYAIGGYNKQQEKYVATVEAYSPQTNSWSVLPSMGRPRRSLGVAVLGGLLYAIGGAEGYHESKSVERYDPVSMRWTPVASMNSFARMIYRDSVQAGVVAGLIYAVGCYHEGNDDFVECNDPNTNEWTHVPNMIRHMVMHHEQSDPSVAVMDNKIYLVGEYDYSDPCIFLEDVKCYDPISCRWKQRAYMNKSRYLHDVAVVDGILYALGGAHDSGTVEKYDPKRKKWTTVKSMNAGREGAFAVGADVY